MTSSRATRDLRWLVVVHGCSAAADAFFTVSLANSLFFNVSLDAARPRLLLYLAITMAPFALLAPLIGPFIGRVRGGQRTVLVAANVLRAALAFALIGDLRTLLMFPEAFGILVLGKAYSIGRSATVPMLVSVDDDLVAANALLARVALLSSAVGGGCGALLLSTTSSSYLLGMSTLLFLCAGIAATSIRARRPEDRRPSRLEYHELRGIRLTGAVQAVGLLRGSIGLFTFVLGFELKRSGAPIWHFGLVMACGGVGAMIATLLSARLRRRMSEEPLLIIALAVPATAAFGGALQFSLVLAVIVSFTVGLAASMGKHVFDSFVQRSAPDADMARAFARFETHFQLFWISGAIFAVVAQPAPRLGMLIMALMLAGGAVRLDVVRHTSERYEASPTLVAAISQLVLEDAPGHNAPRAVLDAAESLLKGGSPRAAVVVAAAALDAHRDCVDDPTALARSAPYVHASGRAKALRESALAGLPISEADCESVLVAVRAALDRSAIEPHDHTS